MVAVKVGGLHDGLDVLILKADLVDRALPGQEDGIAVAILPQSFIWQLQPFLGSTPLTCISTSA